MRRILFTLIILLTPLAIGQAQEPCGGDCNGADMVTVDELVTGVNIALGLVPFEACADGYDGRVTIDGLIDAVHNALYGCDIPSICGGVVTSEVQLCDLLIVPNPVQQGCSIRFRYCAADLEGDINGRCVKVSGDDQLVFTSCSTFFPTTPGTFLNACVEVDGFCLESSFPVGIYDLELSVSDVRGNISNVVTASFTIF